MDVLRLAMYDEVYSTTLQCEGCESVLPGTVEWHRFKSRRELSEVQFAKYQAKEVSHLGTRIYASSQKMFVWFLLAACFTTFSNSSEAFSAGQAISIPSALLILTSPDVYTNKS